MKYFMKISRKNGSSAVEFAMVLPVFLLLLFSIIEYGWYLTNQVVLSNAVASGARAAIRARNWEPYNESPGKFARQAIKEAFWVRLLNDQEIDEPEIIPGDENGPKRIVVTISSLPYKSITGYIAAPLIPDYLAARSVMVFP